ncbi:hypothetical protein [uncultured Enterovirga sp.]|uniref:hypothetical protein n=1 Tax=uncultured Enterovirga sp. TaxID=2026352 RepID=UPI0035C96499
MRSRPDHEAEITAALKSLGLLKPSADASQALNDNPAEVSFPGPGPFLLPMCGETVKLVLRELIMVLQIETVQGQRLDIPLPVSALADLAETVVDALKRLTDDE